MVSIEVKRKIFSEKLKGEGMVLPGAFNALSAKMIEQAGFEGAYISGAALSASAGHPDIGILTLDEMATMARYICQAVEIPCLCDADTGFEQDASVEQTVVKYEEAGLAGLHMEDQVFPKRCGHLQGKELVTSREMCRKIESAVKARKDDNFTIIARCDARSVEGLDEMLERSKEYISAGADAIFPEALTSEEEFKRVGGELNIPLLANMTEFGVSPLLSVEQLKSFGYKLIIFPVSTLRIAMKSCEALLKQIKEQGTQAPLLPEMQTRTELYQLLKYDPNQPN